MKKIHRLLGLAILLLTLNTFAAQAQETKTDTTVLTSVEKPAAFPGGLDGWRRYLEGNLHYPKKAEKKKIQGVVRVEMVVDTKGNISGVKAQNDPGGGLAAEAERVVRNGPNWIPAEQKGQKVSYRFVQNITFELE